MLITILPVVAVNKPKARTYRRADLHLKLMRRRAILKRQAKSNLRLAPKQALTLDTPVELIVGLGNPGSKYERTRHNAGADLVLELAKSLHVELKHESKFFGDTAKVSIDGRDVRLLIPSTFMNLSGKSVAALAGFYQIPPAAILVVHDELDLSPGTARFKKGGGHGGHNGLRDTITEPGQQQRFRSPANWHRPSRACQSGCRLCA